jgi:hypothetical protein
MTKSKSIHEIAQQLVNYWPTKNRIKDSCPEWIRERILATSRRAHLRRVVKEAYAQEAWHSRNTLDFRGWHRDGRIEGPGSGRASDWSYYGFRDLAITAKIVHQLCGYSGDECRTIAHTLHRLPDGCGMTAARIAKLNALPPCTHIPRYFDHGYTEQFERNVAGTLHNHGDGLAGEHATTWSLFLQWEVGRAIAEAERVDRLSRIAANPNYRISGYLAASILAWKGQGGHDYTGGSGCSSYAIHREHPEEWDLLLSQAPVGKKSENAEQVFPHETARADELRARGWVETLRMNDSVFTNPCAAV